jgi:hypothetical protein
MYMVHDVQCNTRDNPLQDLYAMTLTLAELIAYLRNSATQLNWYTVSHIAHALFLHKVV